MKKFKPVKRKISEYKLNLWCLDLDHFAKFHDLDHNPIPLDDMSIDQIYELIQWQEEWDQANV